MSNFILFVAFRSINMNELNGLELGLLETEAIYTLATMKYNFNFKLDFELDKNVWETFEKANDNEKITECKKIRKLSKQILKKKFNCKTKFYKSTKTKSGYSVTRRCKIHKRSWTCVINIIDNIFSLKNKPPCVHKQKK